MDGEQCAGRQVNGVQDVERGFYANIVHINMYMYVSRNHRFAAWGKKLWVVETQTSQLR
jgi:hypothetical protein